MDGLDATLEPGVAGLHDAPLPGANTDLELAGDQAADAAALVAVRQRLAAGSKVDAVAAHQILAGVIEREQGRLEQTSGDVFVDAAVVQAACSAHELVAKDRRTMSTRIQGTTGHTVPGVIDRDVNPAFTGPHGDVASENVDHARARGQRQACAFRQTIFAEPERVGTHRAPVILVSAAAIDHFA